MRHKKLPPKLPLFFIGCKRTISDCYGRELIENILLYCVSWTSSDLYGYKNGGGGEIRTHGRVTPTAVFKTAALDRSATPPFEYSMIPFSMLFG